MEHETGKRLHVEINISADGEKYKTLKFQIISFCKELEKITGGLNIQNIQGFWKGNIEQGFKISTTMYVCSFDIEKIMELFSKLKNVVHWVHLESWIIDADHFTLAK